FLWSYEAFALWDSPWITAWIAVGYFVAAFAVDAIFSEASFCKYVCPIGQFHFVQSLMSPFEVPVRQPDLCATCRTKDRLRGNDVLPGCQMSPLQPRKSGNVDCTFCLDGVNGCPHNSVGLLATFPGRTLWQDSLRSGIGGLSHRPDWTILMLVLIF